MYKHKFLVDMIRVILTINTYQHKSSMILTYLHDSFSLRKLGYKYLAGYVFSLSISALTDDVPVPSKSQSTVKRILLNGRFKRYCEKY